jgi:hypothetical protein
VPQSYGQNDFDEGTGPFTSKPVVLVDSDKAIIYDVDRCSYETRDTDCLPEGLLLEIELRAHESLEESQSALFRYRTFLQRETRI